MADFRADFRIAYIINSMEGGGAQSPLPAIVNSLERAGANARVFALARRDGKAVEWLEDAGISPVIFGESEKSQLAALRWLAAETAKFEADAFFTSLTRATLLGQIIAQHRGIPIVSWQHNAFLKPWNERLLRWRANKSDLWVSDSSCVAEITAQRLRLAHDRTCTWPIFAADPSAPSARPWQQGETLELGSLGRLHPAKGYDVLIAALLRLQNNGWRAPLPVRLSIAGIGQQEVELRKAAQGLTIVDLDFAGFMPRPAAFLAKLHLYLQPSRREGFCIAVHEAMQAGLPIIGSDTGEMSTTITENCGLVIPPEDVIALSDGLADTLSNPAALAARGAAAKERVCERFSRTAFDQRAAFIVDFLRKAAPGS